MAAASSYVLNIALACISSSILLSWVGCTIVWHKYTYLADSVIHVLLVAAILHAISGLPLLACTAIINLLFIGIIHLVEKHLLNRSIVLNVTTTTLIAAGSVVAELAQVDFSVESILFGDLIFVTGLDCLLLFLFLVAAACLLYKYFDLIILTAFNKDIAASMGINVEAFNLALLAINTMAISIAVQIVGGTAVAGMCLIPVIFAKLIGHTPNAMIALCLVFSSICSLTGASAAFQLNLPVPSLICLTQIGVLFLTFFVKGYIVSAMLNKVKNL